jgi:hypothetical protein
MFTQTMKSAFRATALSVATGAAFVLPGVAGAAPVLPSADCLTDPSDITNCLKFDDFAVYSLAFLNYQNGEGDVSPGDTYYVRSSGQPINDALVVATSPGGRRNNTDLGLAGVDDAYNTPNSVPGNSSFVNFLMESPDPSPTFTGDNFNQTTQGDATLPLWDVLVSDVQSFLGGEDLVFWFNLNEENKGGLDDGQDMYAWGQVTLTDTATNTSVTFTLSGNDTSLFPEQSAAQTAGDSILPNASDMWAWVHGEICVDPATGDLVELGPCSTSFGDTVNQNLGAGQAAFALYSPDLNTALYSGLYDLMTVDMRMAHIDNGYEQLFILNSDIPTNVPVPGTILLLGLGLIGMAGVSLLPRGGRRAAA